MSEDASTDASAAGASTAAAAPAAAASTSSVGLPADIVAMVEGEQALADLQAALKAREQEVAQLKAEKQGIVAERDAAGTFAYVAHFTWVLVY